ncbi:MAG: 16S rRNA (uracil(1498)-N(3))-methyltransferase [Opitutaceae bacterium]|nr:16S rRNA (uracil(1498)-N(3))-methyltransferase [Verrucomicrobiales bacterium]
MHRFFLPSGKCHGSVLALDEQESHHAAAVLRLRPGDEATVLDGAGSVLSCVVHSLSKKCVQMEVRERLRVPPLPYKITLLQAIPKSKLIESIIQKATELGVDRVVPLLTTRVSTQLDDERAGSKTEKWQRVAVEAIKQSGCAWLPRVEPPMSVEAFLASSEQFDLALIASLQPGSRHPREYFEAFYAEHQRRPKSVAVWIGPEGDFTPDEVETVTNASARPISLGRQVLRCETAATYCLSVINYELQTPD